MAVWEVLVLRLYGAFVSEKVLIFGQLWALVVIAFHNTFKAFDYAARGIGVKDTNTFLHIIVFENVLATCRRYWF